MRRASEFSGFRLKRKIWRESCAQIHFHTRKKSFSEYSSKKIVKIIILQKGSAFTFQTTFFFKYNFLRVPKFQRRFAFHQVVNRLWRITTLCNLQCTLLLFSRLKMPYRKMPLGTRVVLKMGIVTVFFFALAFSCSLAYSFTFHNVPHFLSLLTFHPSHLQMAFLLF